MELGMASSYSYRATAGGSTAPPVPRRAGPDPLRLRPDRLRGGDALRVHRHRAALLPLHDAELGAHPAAVLLVLDAAVREELGRTVLEVDLVHRLAQLLAVGGAGPLQRLFQDPDLRVGEDRVVAAPWLARPCDAALLDVLHRPARPAGEPRDHAPQG